MNKKILFSIIPVLTISACSIYSQKELAKIENNAKILKKEFVGKYMYDCEHILNSEYYSITDVSVHPSAYGNYIGKKPDDITVYKVNINEKDSYSINNKVNVFDINALRDSINNPKSRPYCSKEEFENTEDGGKDIYRKKVIRNIDKTLLETKDPKIIIAIYKDIIQPNTRRLVLNGFRASYNDDYDIKDISWSQQLAKPTEKLKCLKENHSEYNTDECILTRRNYKGELWFNYQKYLPQIKDDEYFEMILKIFELDYSYEFTKNGYNIISICEIANDVTTEERVNCRKNIDTFFNQMVQKTAPLCKNKLNKEWNNFLISNNSADEFNSIIKGKNIKNRTDFTNQLGKSDYVQSTYDDILNEVVQFGTKNLCSVEGWQMDIKALSGKFRLNNTVELN